MSAEDTLRPADRLEIRVLVDNVLDLLSSAPDSVTTELPNVVAAGASEMSGHSTCCAAWGLSLLVTAHAGDTTRTVLFDAGPQGETLLDNARKLAIDFAQVDEVVLSHGHWDHAGGLPDALQTIRTASGARSVPMHVNAGMFVERAVPLQNGGLLPMGRVPSPEELATAGGHVVSEEGARTLADDLFYVSGAIPRLTSYEDGLPKQMRRAADGSWVPDPLVLDERFLAVHVRGHGLVVLSSCSHAGIVNVLTHAASLFDPIPLHAAVGGLHLSGKHHESKIGATVEDLRQFHLDRIVPGHCTGWRAVYALYEAFGDRVIPGAVAQLHRFG